MDDDRELYTVNDVAERLNMSAGKARLIVMKETDILDFGTPKKAMRRIPREVFFRIIKRATNSVPPTSARRAG